MDTFTDRLLHKKNAQEMIQANSAADTAKMEQLQQQMAEYDTLLQDMRKVNLRAAENMEQMQTLLQTGIGKIEEIKADKADTQAEREALISEINSRFEELMPQIKSQMEEAFKRSDDFLHRENVKVYRNVQAAMTEELEKQTAGLTQKQREGFDRQKPLIPISIIIMLMVIVDIIINLFNIVIKL